MRGWPVTRPRPGTNPNWWPELNRIFAVSNRKGAYNDKTRTFILTRREILMACMAFGALPPQRRAVRAKSSAAKPIFRDVAAEVGLNFHLFSGATGQHFLPEILGAGVALVDYDNDGDLDVYLVQDTRLDERGKLLFPP